MYHHVLDILRCVALSNIYYYESSLSGFLMTQKQCLQYLAGIVSTPL